MMKALAQKRPGKLGDYVIVAVILLSALLLFAFFAGNSTPKTLEVSVDGAVYRTFLLPTEGEYALDALPYPCTLVIAGHTVSLENTTCPGHDCEHGSGASASGDTIVCLPNRLMLWLTGGGNVDTVIK